MVNNDPIQTMQGRIREDRVQLMELYQIYPDSILSGQTN